MSATAKLWGAMAPTFDQIVEHPFLVGLCAGSLPEDIFLGYLVQDAFYLEEYGRCLALLAARSSDVNDLTTLSGKIISSLVAEQVMQADLLSMLGYERAHLMAQREPSPTCMGFTGFIKNTCATAAYHEGFVAVMECPWVYWELGKRLLGKGSPNPVYQKWIDGYASLSMEHAVQALHEIWERLASSLGSEALHSTQEYARQAIRFDWLFWDAAYRSESWPV